MFSIANVTATHMMKRTRACRGPYEKPACTTAHAMKIMASACANGVGLHEKPMPARRTHASPNHRLISRLEGAERPSLLMFSVVILTDLLRGIAEIGRASCRERV